MLLCGMLEMGTRKQQLESVRKEQKDQFQLQCLMAVGSQVSMHDITPSRSFQRRKLEAALFPSRRLLGTCFLGGSSCTLLSFTSFCYILLHISLYHSRDPFTIIFFFLQSDIYDNEIFHSVSSNFTNSFLPAKCVAPF